VKRTAPTDLDPSIGNIDHLLTNRGRSSTPGPPNASTEHLADVLHVSYYSVNPFHLKLKVATIVHDELYDEIEKKYRVFPILPSCLDRSLDELKPEMIVIHRSAFHEGPWFGTEDAAGGIAVDFIRRILPWSRTHSVPVLFIENGMADGYYTACLREIGTEIFPAQKSGGRVPEGAPRSAIYEISQRFSHALPAQIANTEV
jgi:hypothetical protein